MTKYLLPCPKCDAELPIDIGQAGQTILCSECQADVEVPTMRGIHKLRKESSLTNDAPTWSRRQGILFATGLPIMVAALALAAYLLFLRSQIDTSRPEDRFRASEESHIEKMSSAEVWGIWQKWRDVQLQRVDIPQYEKNRHQARKLLILVMASVGVAALGLGAMIAAFVVKPPSDRKSDKQAFSRR
jgi:flagellar basal body-associated protein FliL